MDLYQIGNNKKIVIFMRNHDNNCLFSWKYTSLLPMVAYHANIKSTNSLQAVDSTAIVYL